MTATRSGFSSVVSATSYPTILPLGVSCTYDADGDVIGPETVHHYDFPATVGLLVSVLAFSGGWALVLVRDQRPSVPAGRSPTGREQ